MRVLSLSKLELVNEHIHTSDFGFNSTGELEFSCELEALTYGQGLE